MVALDADAELVWEAGERAYVGSSAQKLRVAAGADLPGALLRQRVGAAAFARHRQAVASTLPGAASWEERPEAVSRQRLGQELLSAPVWGACRLGMQL